MAETPPQDAAQTTVPADLTTETYQDVCKRCSTTSEGDIDLRSNTLGLCALSLLSMSIGQAKKGSKLLTDGVRVAEKLRLALIGSEGDATAIEECMQQIESLLPAQLNIRLLGDSILTYLEAETLYTYSIITLALMCESSAIDISAFLVQPSPAADATLKSLLLQLKALFEDSKVTRSKAQKELQQVQTEMLTNLADLSDVAGRLRRLCRSQLEANAVNGNSALQRRQKECAQIIRDTLLGDLKMSKLIVKSLAEEKASLTEDIAKIEQNEEAARLINSLPANVAGADISRWALAIDTQLESLSRSSQSMITSTQCVKSMILLTGELVTLSKISVINQAVAKTIANKKNINWSLKFGKGSSECVDFVCNKLAQEMAVPISSSPDAQTGPSSERGGCSVVLMKEYEQATSLLQARTGVVSKPKVAKGCIDFTPQQMRLREEIFARVTSIFKLYNAEPIDTPVFELTEVLNGKYGEDQKLIYELKDQGGELLGLRYDLTVPFARYCATNNIEKIKRFHIGKVYRRDEPQIAKGRLREFYQCDIDIAGDYGKMTADAEIISMLIHLLRELNPIIGDFKVKISHRKVLDGMMALAEVPADKFRAISSAIDKLDKEPWSVVQEEMVATKGLALESASKLKDLVGLQGTITHVCDALEKLGESNESLTTGIDELRTLRTLVGDNCDEVLMMDTSLARGLDYYTGVIYEAVIIAGEVPVGSIAAGGRYDKLIGMFSGKDIPSVGVSLGIERVFRMCEAKFAYDGMKLRSKENSSICADLNSADVFVATIGNISAATKAEITQILRKANIKAETALSDKLKFNKQLQHVLDKNIPVAVIIGEEELANGVVRIRHFHDDETLRFPEMEVRKEHLVANLQTLLSRIPRSNVSSLLFASQ